VSSSSARRPRYTVHDGFRMPMGFPVAGFESGQRYVAAPGDVFVASYPKCGTTWTQYIVYLLLHDARPLTAGQKIDDVFPHLEEVGRDVVGALPAPRLIKTHLPFERTPWSPDAKYVYVARNPFDCAVSFYHHTRGFPRHYDFAEGTWDAYFECFLLGEVDFGDYFDNLLSWWPRRADPNVLFLSYERMVADPEAAVAAIARLVGGRAVDLVADARGLERVVRLSSFGEMQRDQGRWSSQRPADMPGFVRKGVVGDYANYFTSEQARKLVTKMRERMAGTALETLWPELDAAVSALTLGDRHAEQ
jgi:sulfotransferase